LPRAAQNTISLANLTAPSDWHSLIPAPRSTQPLCNDTGVNRRPASEVSTRLGIMCAARGRAGRARAWLALPLTERDGAQHERVRLLRHVRHGAGSLADVPAPHTHTRTCTQAIGLGILSIYDAGLAAGNWQAGGYCSQSSTTGCPITPVTATLWIQAAASTGCTTRSGQSLAAIVDGTRSTFNYDSTWWTNSFTLDGNNEVASRRSEQRNHA
jgi:hypothetical protein